MLADTSDIHALGAAQRRYAEHLAAVAAVLRSAQTDPDAFGSVGTGFLTALNGALAHEAGCAERLAERLTAAGDASQYSAASYTESEFVADQFISSLQA